MIKAAVLGATGYAGIELVRLLTSHPEVSIEILGSHSFVGQKISDVYKNFNHVLEKECEELDLDKVGACDVAFTALPHGAGAPPPRSARRYNLFPYMKRSHLSMPLYNLRFLSAKRP